MSTVTDQLKLELMGYLYQQGRWLPSMLAKLEAATSIPRENFAYGFLGVTSAYLVLGHFAQLLCNFIGFAYPAYASFKALETEDKTDDTQWLTYWTVFACISLVDFASATIMGYFFIYWLAKCIFLLWLYLPLFRGAQQLYVGVFRPWFLRLRPMFGNVETQMQERAQQVVVQGVQQQLAHEMQDNQQPQQEHMQTESAPVTM